MKQNLLSPARWLWTLDKLVVLFLGATYLGLTIDLRYEHVDKVRQHWTAWIPIAYSAAMSIVCPVCVAFWNRWGRPTLAGAFAVGLAVGGVGFWLHNRGHVWADVATTLKAWSVFEHHSDDPPTLAPLAFAGLGVLGILGIVFPCTAASEPSVADARSKFE